MRELKTEVSRAGIVVTGSRGRIFTTKLAADKVYFYFDGHVEAGMFAPTMPFANEVLRSGAATLYGDGPNWKTYEPAFRSSWTDWFIQNRASLAHTYLLAPTKLIRMGIQVVNLFSPNAIDPVDDSSVIYRLLARDVPRIREVTASWPEEISAHALRSGLAPSPRHGQVGVT